VKIIDVLRQYAKPATGCTEAAALALAAAAAREPMGGDIRNIEVAVDKNVLRNALSAVVPGADGQPGIRLTAALGAVGGDPHLGLQVLDAVTASDLAVAKSLVASGAVAVEMDRSRSDLYVEVTVHTAEGTGRAVIERSHANVTLVESNGQRRASPVSCETGDDSEAADAIREWVRSLNVPELISSVCSMEPGAAEYTRHGINMNEHVAREGLHHAPGLAIGARLARSKGYGTHDPILAAQTLTAAAVDARMAGLPVPVMTSSGSGNQGIMVVLPSLAVARTLALDEQCLIRSVALGHVLLARFCEQLGPLTPLCGSALHAAAASSASVSHLLGGDALKAASGAQLAVRAALLSVGDLRVGPGNGLMDKGLAELIEDLVLLASAMDGASDLVLDILARDAP
jgi:L-cysteine desulfidase